jgi:hypothetical protein
MPVKAKKPPMKRAAIDVFVLGRERFAKISAVEGVTLTPAMRKRIDDFDRLGLSPAERRREILKVYREKA